MEIDVIAEIILVIIIAVLVLLMLRKLTTIKAEKSTIMVRRVELGGIKLRLRTAKNNLTSGNYMAILEAEKIADKVRASINELKHELRKESEENIKSLRSRMENDYHLAEEVATNTSVALAMPITFLVVIIMNVGFGYAFLILGIPCTLLTLQILPRVGSRLGKRTVRNYYTPLIKSEEDKIKGLSV